MTVPGKTNLVFSVMGVQFIVLVPRAMAFHSSMKCSFRVLLHNSYFRKLLVLLSCLGESCQLSVYENILKNVYQGKICGDMSA